ncbi:MAG: exodeoxyribonuclease III [Pseudomonadota bacterium]|nr:exodeoxyribonuclease III [Pseudomonadota bacterium]
MSFSVATWNINSVRRRLDLVEQFTRDYAPDVLCLQEIKCADASFPASRLRAMGYSHIEIRGQNGYHGVATLSRFPLRRLDCGDFAGLGHARHLCVEVTPRGSAPVILHNFYIPAGGDIPDERANPKFGEKLRYIAAASDWFESQAKAGSGQMLLVGDLNVAPLETDVWSHKQLLKVVSHTPREVELLTRLQASRNWVDVMRRHFPPEETLFTWWCYRAKDWRASNRGRRLDHIWASRELAQKSIKLQLADETRDWEAPSDHIPVVAHFDPGRSPEERGRRRRD